jgi:hypothetical protein
LRRYSSRRRIYKHSFGPSIDDRGNCKPLIRDLPKEQSATFIEDAYRRAVTATLSELSAEGSPGMRVRWKLRLAAAKRKVWTGAQLRRLLAEKAGLEMSAASVSALFRGC